MELEVKGCSDCKLCVDYFDLYFCDVKTEMGSINTKKYTPQLKQTLTTPSWCPLKIEPIIITLKEN